MYFLISVAFEMHIFAVYVIAFFTEQRAFIVDANNYKQKD